MNKTPILIAMLLMVSNYTFCQTTIEKKTDEAFSFYNNKDYEKCLKLLRELHSEVDRKDSTFSEIAYYYSASLYFQLAEKKKKDDWAQIIYLSKEFLKGLEEDKDLLDMELQENKYWSYKDIVVAFFGLGQRDSAAKYQKILYKARENKELPEVLDEYYNFEKFVYNDQNVWGYEWYAQLGDKETQGSFSKHIYYIYSRNSDGSDKEQLFTLETVKIHKLKDDSPEDYVLTKRIYSDDREQSETIWTYTFEDPIDYKKLHNAVVEFLERKVKTDTKSIIKH